MKASKLKKGESLKINGRFNTCHIKCVDVVKLQEARKSVRTFLLSNKTMEALEESLGMDWCDAQGFKSECIINKDYLRLEVENGSVLHKAIIEVLETERGLHRKALSAIKRAFINAHNERIAFVNGCVRVVRRMAKKIETAFEKLFVFDVRKGRKINLQEA